MKRIINITVICFSLVFFYGCKEYEMADYGEGGEINFLADEAWAEDYTGKGPSWSGTADLLYKFNFGINELGENLKYDTVLMAVKVMGDAVGQPRRVALAVKPSSMRSFEVIFPSEEQYVVQPGTFAAVFAIVIQRPALQISDTATLLIDYDKSDFLKGARERQEVKLIVQDLVNQKLWKYDENQWKIYGKYLGTYSDTKARFLMTQYGCVSFEKWVGKITALGRANRFYEDLEAYKADASKPELIDENTGEWIAFPNQVS